MDKLQWFKFTPTDWIMGKIQRTPEITQARFMRLVCLYWNKECVLTVDDAEIEIDKEHLDILLSKKILKVENELIRIEFLDEQYKDLRFELEGKSKSGIIGNLKRWHKAIYSRFITGKITFEEAVELAKASHTDNTPITDQSQNIADKNREEKNREDNTSFKKETKYSFKADMIQRGFDEDLIDAWLVVRKLKKGANTKIALDGFVSNINESGMDKNEVLRICVEKSWAGFKPIWLIETQPTLQNGSAHPYAVSQQLKKDKQDELRKLTDAIRANDPTF